MGILWVPSERDLWFLMLLEICLHASRRVFVECAVVGVTPWGRIIAVACNNGR